MSLDYSQVRKQFFSGHNGSSVEEVVAITCVNQLANFLFIGLLSLFPILTDNNWKWFCYGIEYVIIMTPFILGVTLFSNHIFFISFIIVFSTFGVIVICFMRRQSKPIVVKELLDLEVPYEGRIPFLTNLFSTLLICVCIAILGVDFRVFPRRFAKTEIYGWSLMDVGVGSFIVLNGGFSPEARLGSEYRQNPMVILKKTVFSTIPLFVLGFQRLIALQSVDYYKHITEYGVHWNFFFTLSFTKLFSATLCYLFSHKLNIGFCGIVLMVIHQICLSLGLNKFIQNEDRNGLLAANKEGIISLMGYISIYLIFVELGKHVIKKRTKMREWLQLSLEMFSITLIFGLLMILSNNYIENISRREVNLSFVCWMVSLNSLFIGLEFLIQTVVHCLQHLKVFCSSHYQKSIIFSSFGSNGLLIFLVANLLTGLVNFTVDTISASDMLALIVLIVYSVVLSFVVVFFDKNKIQFIYSKIQSIFSIKRKYN